MRTEQQVFDELADLCVRPGFIHVIAYFCFRDHVVGYKDELKGEDYAKLFSHSRLIRTEISTLIGLMVRAPRDHAVPPTAEFERLANKAESLLEELHDVLKEPVRSEMIKAMTEGKFDPAYNPFKRADALREPIFYAAESAYPSQYRDFSVPKYAQDADWLRRNKGFSPDEAKAIAMAITSFLNAKLLTTVRGLGQKHPKDWTLFDGFVFTTAEIAEEFGLAKATVDAVVDAFTLPEDGNPAFSSLGDFNAANAFPILRGEGDARVLLLCVSLTEALYDTPFYWLNGDKAYRQTASANRGAFTEDFTAERLKAVFGADRVFLNVDIWETSARKKKLGEVDVLAMIGDIAILVQAKSKKLTLSARKGNDLQLQSDFKGAVQDACDQAVDCAKHLLAGGIFVADPDGNEIATASSLTKIHPVCVVSDHYPSLTFQAQQFLTIESVKGMQRPLVCDVFFIDVMAEFLTTPLRFLSYLELRSLVGDRIGLSHEIVALGYHLKKNLWLGEYDYFVLDDDLSADIDIAMAARREGIDGQKTPRGVLTDLQDTTVGRLISEIEARSEPRTVAVGLELLKLSGASALQLSRMIDGIVVDTQRTGKRHDITFAIEKDKTGITVHCNFEPDWIAANSLKQHCELRKYSIEASKWFGMSVSPGDGAFRFGIALDYEWKRNFQMDAQTATLPAPKSIDHVERMMFGGAQPVPGRNDPCYCGSGLKYKKCHLPRD
ncbi:SEC-C domain-containing protein [Sinorhizobium meliloti]|uniref:SEC-C domain-containing protein n=1 Tax=Rhizobium meliloti TaxID=382 RepID=UPI000416167B|nr:SEC-C domain-containing protein [Sinorhizobium meliloti]UFX07666.1 SEC-C domain-containing protein [Sinorhizobium meliloti]